MMHKLVVKIFLGMVLIFGLIMVLQLFIQDYLINDIYMHTKESRMDKAFEELIETYEPSQGGSLENFRADMDVAVLTFNQAFDLDPSFFDAFTSMTLRSDQDLYRVSLGDYVDEESKIRQELKALEAGETLPYILCPLPGSDLYIPYKISGYTMSPLARALYERWPDQALHVEGVLEELDRVERQAGVAGYQGDVLLVELINLFEEAGALERLEDKGLVKYDFIEERSGLHRFVYLGKSQEGTYIMTLMTLENVSDAFAVLNSYYGLIFGLMIGLAILLSLIFTRLITRPILKINKVALAIADQDFETKAHVKSKDELETLSKSLETISRNMKGVIGQLEASNDDLAIALIKGQENEERMRNMLSALSHEFKTPLGISSGFIEVIRDGVGDQPDHYYLDSIEEELDRLDTMVKETLALTQLEAGHYKLREASFSLGALVQRLVNKMALNFEEKSQKLIFDYKACWVCADENKIEQVVRNLLSNAHKYAPENSVISLELDKDTLVSFSLKNETDILQEEDLPYVWDRFYRAEKSRHKAFGGSGLGLAIVKQILALHGQKYGVSLCHKTVNFYFELKPSRDELS